MLVASACDLQRLARQLALHCQDLREKARAVFAWFGAGGGPIADMSLFVSAEAKV